MTNCILPLTFHDELKEVSFGALEGAPFSEENKKKYKALKYNWRPSGESVEDVKARVIKIVAYIGSKSGDGEALIITHGGIIRMLRFLEDGTCLDGLGHSSIFEFDLSKILKSA
jgi:broad specificity phosphatase PhoE